MSEQTFFFYDLETSGLSCRKHRIMQFAGQRTDRNFNLIGEPLTFLVRLDREVAPELAALFTTGITPQQTVAEGVSEREAITRIMEQAFTPNTIAIGFNNIRFDDEFIRFTAYRNFYDAYEWAWQDGRSRFDLIDVVRMVRALRPDGISWTFDANGLPSNTLEKLAIANGLRVDQAHDAMSDVLSTIEVARLLQEKQPKMFSFLLEHRSKERVAEIVDPARPRPFVYTNTMYGPECLYTTVALAIGYGHQKKIIVYNLTLDPLVYDQMSVSELQELRFMKTVERLERGLPPFPAKELQCNRCPAVAPRTVLGESEALRLGIDKHKIVQHEQSLMQGELKQKLIAAFAIEQEYDPADAEGSLYSAFFNSADKRTMATVRQTPLGQLGSLSVEFADPRLTTLLTHYRARNCPESLSNFERDTWNTYKQERLVLNKEEFETACSSITDLSGPQEALLGELRSWIA